MKKHILPAIKLTLVLIVFFAVIYPIAVWGMAQFSSNKGKGDTVEFKGKNITRTSASRSLQINTFGRDHPL